MRLCDDAPLIEVVDLSPTKALVTPVSMTRTTYPALCAIFFVHLFLRCTRLPLLTCFHHTRAVEACEVRVPRFPASLSVLPGGRRHVFFGRAREPSHGKENRGSSAQLRNRQKLAVQLVRGPTPSGESRVYRLESRALRNNTTCRRTVGRVAC